MWSLPGPATSQAVVIGSGREPFFADTHAFTGPGSTVGDAHFVNDIAATTNGRDAQSHSAGPTSGIGLRWHYGEHNRQGRTHYSVGCIRSGQGVLTRQVQGQWLTVMSGSRLETTPKMPASSVYHRQLMCYVASVMGSQAGRPYPAVAYRRASLNGWIRAHRF